MEPEITLLPEEEVEEKEISAQPNSTSRETTALSRSCIQHEAAGDLRLSCGAASDLIIVVNEPEGQMDSPRREPNEETIGSNEHHSDDEQSVEAPREVAFSENRETMKILQWFHSTFSEMERQGHITLKDFKHTAKSSDVSIKITLCSL